MNMLTREVVTTAGSKNIMTIELCVITCLGMFLIVSKKPPFEAAFFMDDMAIGLISHCVSQPLNRAGLCLSHSF